MTSLGVESHSYRHSLVPVQGENLKERFGLSTLEKIVEMHRVMFTANRRLSFYEFEGEEGNQKLLATHPWMWPLLYRGCPGHASDLHSLYFIGSPHVYFLNLAVLCALPVLAVCHAFQRARQTPQIGENRTTLSVAFQRARRLNQTGENHIRSN